MSLHQKHGNAYRRRGYGRRGFLPDTRRTTLESTAIGPTAPLGDVVKSINLQELNGTFRTSDLRAQSSEIIATFNMLSGPGVAIAVPGVPPKWTPLQDQRILEEDSGTYYRDVNAAHNPQGHWHATIETLMQQPGTGSFQVLACGSTLGCLVRFASGGPPTCRMLVNYIGGVLHLTRREASPKTIIPDVVGYGHSFPEANTTWDRSVKSSTSHQRVVKFRFAGLDLAVRSEADGYLPDEAGPLNYVSSDMCSTKHNHKSKASIEDLDDAFAKLGHRSSSSYGTGDLEVKNAGASVPQRAIFDLKTRSIKRRSQEAEIIAGEIPRLWVRHVPNLILGYHQSGLFTHVITKDIRPDVLRWEEDNRESLGRLGALLRIIIATAKAEPSGKLELTLEAESLTLQLREQLQDAPQLFPKEAASRWEEWLTSSVQGKDIESGGETDLSSEKLDGRDREPESLSVCDEE